MHTVKNTSSAGASTPLLSHGQQRGPITFFKRSILHYPGKVMSALSANRHEPGSTVKFRGSGARYLITSTGAIQRADPKPYANKAELKARKRARVWREFKIMRQIAERAHFTTR